MKPTYKNIYSYNFPTRYKIGESILCTKTLIYNNKIILQIGKKYKITRIYYNFVETTGGTIFNPQYIINNVEYGFSSNEYFHTTIITHGAQGSNGYGSMEEYFSEKINQRIRKLEKIKQNNLV